MRPTVVVACALAALLLAVPAGAAGPATVLTAGISGGHAVVTWSLTDGGQTWTVEVATSSATDASGAFPVANVVDLVAFPPSTLWIGTTELDPGAYYVHVLAAGCAACAPQWSNVSSFAVAAPATTTPTTSDATTTETTAAATTPVATTTAATALAQTTPTTAAPAVTQSSQAAPPVARRNAAPRLASVSLRRSGAHAHAILRACDDRAGILAVGVAARRGRAVALSRPKISAASSGCWPYLVDFRLPVRSGRVVVTLRVRDAAGAWSRAVVRAVR